jgi:hypothetical protein
MGEAALYIESDIALSRDFEEAFGVTHALARSLLRHTPVDEIISSVYLFGREGS